MQTELVNQIEVKLRKIYQAAYQPAYLKKNARMRRKLF